LADEATEDAVYDSQSIRRFIGIDLRRESAPDATTLLHFRRLLEEHDLTRAIFEAIKGHLADQGLLLREGTIVDATIEEHDLTRAIFEAIKGHLADQGLLLREGTIVDATLIAAPPSTKNRAQARYRGLAKNTAQLFSRFALANRVLARRLLPPQGVSAS